MQPMHRRNCIGVHYNGHCNVTIGIYQDTCVLCIVLDFSAAVAAIPVETLPSESTANERHCLLLNCTAPFPLLFTAQR